jgi:glutamine amidotransferase
MIGIINYGVGNIKAFENIYRKLHIPVKILTQASDFEGVTKLILPGVGAFDHAMNAFNNSGMRAIAEQKVLEENVPVIGICVGMQMLANSSEEGTLSGLGWIDGTVKKFDESKIAYDTHLPHMGWNDVNVSLEQPLFNDFPADPKYYFLHSYYFECGDATNAIAQASYGIDFTCAVRNNNVYGVQFHPEKSHEFGVKLLENYSKL